MNISWDEVEMLSKGIVDPRGEVNDGFLIRELAKRLLALGQECQEWREDASQLNEEIDDLLNNYDEIPISTAVVQAEHSALIRKYKDE